MDVVIQVALIDGSQRALHIRLRGDETLDGCVTGLAGMLKSDNMLRVSNDDNTSETLYPVTSILSITVKAS